MPFVWRRAAARLATASLLLALTMPLRAEPATSARIALLLPQSGRMNQVATAIRDGLLAAYYQDKHSGADSPVLQIYDSDSLPVLALLQQAKAAGATLAIGPLDRERVQQLLTAAPLPLPVLSLNRVEGRVDNLYQFALAPEDEIQRLVAWMSAQGIRRPLILASPDEASQRLQNLFAAFWQARHGQQAAVFELDSSPRGGLVGRLKQLQTQSGAADALFLANASLAQQVLPTLTYVRNTLPLYATAQAWEPAADASGLHDLEGLRFCGQPWMLEAARPEQTALYASFGRPKAGYDRLYAFGADAWTLTQAWPALLDGEAIALRSGRARLDAAHYVRLMPSCAEVRNGAATLLWPADADIDVPINASTKLRPSR